jgi:hypothetical protein
VSRSSLTDQLADLRRACTGENLSQAVPAVRALDVSSDVLTAALRDPSAPFVGLLPSAASEAQRQLEARLLMAACAASSYLQFRPPASIVRPAPVFTAVEPESMRLHLAEGALGPLLYEVLPRTEEGYPMGVAGLTHEQHRRSVSLRVGDASVVLAGVDEAAWAVGMRWVRWMVDFRGLTTVMGEGGVTEPVQLAATGSELLRRIGLFAQASWTRVLPFDPWWFEWAGGPSWPSVHDALRHPLFGTAAEVQLRRQDAPTQDLDPNMKTWPWPAEFVS